MKCLKCKKEVDGAAIVCYKWNKKTHKLVKSCEHILKANDELIEEPT